MLNYIIINRMLCSSCIITVQLVLKLKLADTIMAVTGPWSTSYDDAPYVGKYKIQIMFVANICGESQEQSEKVKVNIFLQEMYDLAVLPYLLSLAVGLHSAPAHVFDNITEQPFQSPRCKAMNYPNPYKQTFKAFDGFMTH